MKWSTIAWRFIVWFVSAVASAFIGWRATADGEGFFKWLQNVLEGAWAWLWSSHLVNGWLIVAAIAIALTCANLILKSRKSAKPKPPKWTKFTEMELGGVHWRWSYFLGVGAVLNLSSHCPVTGCDFRLRVTQERRGVSRDMHSTYFCPRCEYRREIEGSIPDIANYVREEISRRIRVDYKGTPP